MTRNLLRRVAATLALAGLWAVPAPAAEEDWYPSRFGPEDRIGAANYLAPEIVKRAADLVTTGKAYSLGMEWRRHACLPAAHVPDGRDAVERRHGARVR